MAEFLTVLVIFVFVLCLTYFSTRFVAGFEKQKITGQNIEVIETLRITTGKYIQIVRLGARYIAIGVSKDGITMLSEVPEEDITLPKVQDAGLPPSFKGLLEQFRNKKGKGGTGE